MKSVNVSEQDTWFLKANLRCCTYFSVSRLFSFGDFVLEVLKSYPHGEASEVGVPIFFVLQLNYNKRRVFLGFHNSVALFIASNLYNLWLFVASFVRVDCLLYGSMVSSLFGFYYFLFFCVYYLNKVSYRIAGCFSSQE